jgi:hypothetical protein
MLIATITTNIWLALSLWVCIYIADYALTIWGARLYEQGAYAYIRFDGSYELNPLFERDIDQHRRISRRFLLMLVATSLLIWFIWRGTQLRLFPSVAFTFLLGALLLMEVPVLIRHARNLFMFSTLLSTSDVRGQISYPRWFSLQTSAVEFGLFALLFLIIGLLTSPWFFFGGAFGCLRIAVQHWQLARRAKQHKLPQAEANT